MFLLAVLFLLFLLFLILRLHVFLLQWRRRLFGLFRRFLFPAVVFFLLLRRLFLFFLGRLGLFGGRRRRFPHPVKQYQFGSLVNVPLCDPGPPVSGRDGTGRGCHNDVGPVAGYKGFQAQFGNQVQ